MDHLTAPNKVLNSRLLRFVSDDANDIAIFVDSNE
jgi:hypothetical protein